MADPGSDRFLTVFFPLMRSIRLLRKIILLSLALLLASPGSFLFAGKSEPPAKGFSIKLSQDWIELSLPFQGVVASYGKKGTLATFHITERNLEGVKTVEQLKWEDLFSPEFKSIDIRTQNVTVLGGEKAKFCVYTLKPGEFKDTMEGKLPGKYINYVLIHGGKLFSITFKDAEEEFPSTYPSFLAVIRTLQFDAQKPVPQRKPV
jgi:hypothetical protein